MSKGPKRRVQERRGRKRFLEGELKPSNIFGPFSLGWKIEESKGGNADPWNDGGEGEIWKKLTRIPSEKGT